MGATKMTTFLLYAAAYVFVVLLIAHGMGIVSQ
jgi:hypothetical protein